MNRPIAWGISGSDSSGGAGIQADLLTFHALGVHGCSVLTALTAQNSYQIKQITTVPADMVAAQLAALDNDLPAAALKLGVLGDVAAIQQIAKFLASYDGVVVCDPVLRATVGGTFLSEAAMQQVCTAIFPHVDIITPNWPEATALTGIAIESLADVSRAAQQLLAMGVASVLIKGGHGSGQCYCDYWSDGEHSVWLNQLSVTSANVHGTGCSLASAITASIAHGYSVTDALVIAKMYVTQGIRVAQPLGQGSGAVAHLAWPEHAVDLPWLTTALQERSQCFLDCGPEPLGFYPLVDSVAWLEQLLPLGVKTIQLRIKGKTGEALEQEIAQAVSIAQRYSARLFINDYWQLAIKHGAYGVHLGQEDLTTADCATIASAGLRLGVSTHNYTELARAHAVQPSYVALGPIFATQSKQVASALQGLESLRRWCRVSPYPVVAIGGITQDNVGAVLANGANGFAVIAGVTKAADPLAAARHFLSVSTVCNSKTIN